MRLRNPKTTGLIFSSGKMVIIGVGPNSKAGKIRVLVMGSEEERVTVVDTLFFENDTAGRYPWIEGRVVGVSDRESLRSTSTARMEELQFELYPEQRPKS